MDTEAGPGVVDALDADADRRAAGIRFVDLRVQTDLAQLSDDVCRGLNLARSRAVAGIRRVDPQQVPAQVDDLVLGLDGGGLGGRLGGHDDHSRWAH